MTAARRDAAAVYATAARARNLKAEYGVGSRRDVAFVLKPAGEVPASSVAVLKQLVGAAKITLDPAFSPPAGTAVAVTDLGELFMPLEGLIDLETERARLRKEVTRVEGEIERAEAKLSNPSFAEKAPPDVVAKAREVLAEWQEKRTKLAAMLANLG